MNTITLNRLVNHYELDGQPLPFDKSLLYKEHSPTGFAWGYAGSGPSQLALAILLAAVPEEPEVALALYQDFKFELVARWPGEKVHLCIEIDLNQWIQVKLAQPEVRARVHEQQHRLAVFSH